MPDDLAITSYGHCYQVLIVTNLVKMGIPTEDNAINACFNFAEKLAFKIYQKTKLQPWDNSFLDAFVEEYNIKFVIKDSILSRLKNDNYGIINSEGFFRTKYMYYFFLGRYLSKEARKNKGIIDQMCEQSHVSSNYLTLLFVIHHTNDNEIIDDILLRTMCTLDNINPAKLNQNETKGFTGNCERTPRKYIVQP